MPDPWVRPRRRSLHAIREHSCPRACKSRILYGRGSATSPGVALPARSGLRPHPVRRCLPGGTPGRLLLAVLLLVALAGCAKYNTYYNAKKAFDQAELVRTEAIRKHEDPPKPAGLQKTDYETAIQKAQKVLDEYPGHDLTDDALFLQAKAWHRLESYRMSIRKLDLLFRNFPATRVPGGGPLPAGPELPADRQPGQEPGIPGPARAPLPRQQIPVRDPEGLRRQRLRPGEVGRGGRAPTGATWTRISAPPSAIASA